MPETFFNKLKPKTRLFVGVAVFIVIILVILAIEQPYTGPSTVLEGIELQDQPVNSSVEIGVNIGNQAPDFALLTDSGEIIQLSQFRGEKAVFLNFWASWCPFCLNEMPEMQKVADDYSDKLIILAVNRGESKERASQYYYEKIPEESSITLTYPYLLDQDETVSRTYILRGMPVSYFIDKNGIIVDRKFSSLIPEEMKSKAEAAINN